MFVGDVEDLFQNLPVALYRSGRDGQLLASNPALANLLGYETVEDLLAADREVTSFYTDPSARDRWLAQITSEGVVYDFDVELVRANGDTVWVRDTARAIFDETGELAYCEGALIDVTEKVRARKARDEFVAAVSHELRNPLSVLLGLAQELATDYEGFTDADRKDMADVMARQADDASWIIEDLLIAYREDTSQVRVVNEAFDVSLEIGRVLETIDAPVSVDLDEDAVMVEADPRRTRQILRNLVTNAIRYGGDEVTIRARRSPVPGAIEISVSDSGEPLGDDEARRIFEPFERGSVNIDGKSVGLGLAVARKLAVLMGGGLEYSHDGRQASFIVTLPAAA